MLTNVIIVDQEILDALQTEAKLDDPSVTAPILVKAIL